ncbi:MAG: hypothetical protein ACRDRB_26175, partial [Pseudonocardiaceae bacterium]
HGRQRSAAGVEVRLSSAQLRCPGCGDRLAPWGYARVRIVRGDGLVRWRLRPPLVDRGEGPTTCHDRRN